MLVDWECAELPLAALIEDPITGVIRAMNVTLARTAPPLDIHQSELTMMNTESTITKSTRACAITTSTEPQSLDERGRVAVAP